MELYRALGSLIEAPAPEHRRVAESLSLPLPPTAPRHASVVAFQRYPYASIYLGTEGMMGGEARDRIAGFWRALRLDVPHEPDHLALLLSLLTSLGEWRKEPADAARGALLDEARITLAWEHILSWSGPYLTTFQDCGDPFFLAWAELLDRSLTELAVDLELPDYLPGALRDAPELADPRIASDGSFLDHVLTPVRSGMVVIRDDLVRLADDLGLAHRAGERRYALKAFLAQEPSGTLAWLAGHAARWSGRVATAGPQPVASWWAERARRSGVLFRELAGEPIDLAVAGQG